MSRIGTSRKYIPAHTVLPFFSSYFTYFFSAFQISNAPPPFKGAQRGVKLRRLHNEGAPLHLPLFLIFFIILNFYFCLFFPWTPTPPRSLKRSVSYFLSHPPLFLFSDFFYFSSSAVTFFFSFFSLLLLLFFFNPSW